MGSRYDKGVAYLGAAIKPGRVYVGKRMKANFYRSIEKHNQVLGEFGRDKPGIEVLQSFQSSMNSYLGIMRHHDTYRLRKGMVSKNVKGWWRFAYVNGGVTKFVAKP